MYVVYKYILAYVCYEIVSRVFWMEFADISLLVSLTEEVCVLNLHVCTCILQMGPVFDTHCHMMWCQHQSQNTHSVL